MVPICYNSYLKVLPKLSDTSYEQALDDSEKEILHFNRK